MKLGTNALNRQIKTKKLQNSEMELKVEEFHEIFKGCLT